MAFALLSRPKRAATVPRMPMKRSLGPGRHVIDSRPGFEKTATPLPGAPVVQTKLKIGEPNDKFEQEADRVAEQVMRMPEPQALEGAAISGSTSPTRIQRLCRECEEELHRQPMEKEEEEEEAIQAKETSGRTPEVTPAVQVQIDGLRGGGQPLPASTRAFFEPRFGRDFGAVRVHTGGRASALARAVQARAFTSRGNIVFGAGEFAPGTHEGRRLLAHELVHVIQQHKGENTRRLYDDTLRRSVSSLSQISDNSSSSMIQRQKGRKARAAGKQIVIIANGYPGYSSDKKEIKDSQKGLWLPNTPDFTTTASDTQKSFSGASTADEFFGALQSVGGKIERVAFIGHGNPAGLGLSGKPMSWFEKGLEQSDLTRWQNSIDSDIKPKFVEDATLDIYACNVAAGGAFIKALAQSLGICVRGFTGAVYWCLGYKGNAITSRGRIAGSRVAAECSDKRWSKGVNKLTPPDKTCP